MNDILYIIIMGLLGLYSTVVGSGLTDGRRLWFKSLNKKGKSVAVAGVIMLGLSIFQYVMTKREEKKLQETAAVEKRKSDSTMKAEIQRGIDVGLQQIAKGIGISFNSQGLKIDSLSFLVSAVRDSARGIRTIVTPELPPLIQLRYNSVDIKSGNGQPVVATISFFSLTTDATNLNISGTCFVEYNKTGIFPVSYNLGNPKAVIPKGSTRSIQVYLDPVTYGDLKRIMIYAKGSYSNSTEKITRPIDDLYEFDPKSNTTAEIGEPDKTAFLKSVKPFIK